MTCIVSILDCLRIHTCKISVLAEHLGGAAAAVVANPQSKYAELLAAVSEFAEFGPVFSSSKPSNSELIACLVFHKGVNY